jgi:hypothetical protein
MSAIAGAAAAAGALLVLVLRMTVCHKQASSICPQRPQLLRTQAAPAPVAVHAAWHEQASNTCHQFSKYCALQAAIVVWMLTTAAAASLALLHPTL